VYEVLAAWMAAAAAAMIRAIRAIARSISGKVKPGL
jgi:hypothetical protein